MGSSKLKEDLNNCLINFDRRVLITELLDDYQMAYEEVNSIVQNFVEEQEKKDKLKFDKKYIVHGVEEGEYKKEIYKVVEENKLKECLKKLKTSQSSLYSVEVAGGAKSAAPIFKPMSVEKDVKLRTRQCTKASAANGSAETASEKQETEQANTSKNHKVTPPQSIKSNAKVEASIKRTSPKTETSPSDGKATEKKSNKKGISNFFAPTTAVLKKSEDTKDSKSASGVSKSPLPKKMKDFFKKQAEKPKTNIEDVKKPAVNTSIQLFEDDEEEEPEEISSDEEEKLEALKRDIISSDVEMDAEDDGKPSTSAKRRRILDSDDDEDPPVKQEKLDIKEESKEEEAVAETYLDEDGFVITKKPKQKAKPTNDKSPSTKKCPPVTIKTSPKGNKKSVSTANKDLKPAPNPATKTKQAGIMNFFSKK